MTCPPFGTEAFAYQTSTVPFKARRDLTALETFETDNHNLTTSDYSTSSDAATLFASYKNVSCILTPEVTYGPYYVSGELIRSDVVGGQEGVPVHLEYQYIDVSTCEPVSGLYVDTWQANATGVYSGVVASGNGNEADTANLVRPVLSCPALLSSPLLSSALLSTPLHSTPLLPSPLLSSPLLSSPLPAVPIESYL